MNLEEKLALIGRWREVILHDDFDAVIELCTDDIVLDYSESIGPMKGIYEGPDGLERFGRDMRGSFSETEVTAEEPEEVGDCLVVQTRMDVKGVGSGATATSVGGFLFRFRDGRISLMKLFQSKEDALAEARDA